MAFPDDFTWGAAAAAYQVEGGATADGRGPSVWDVFCRRPGAVLDGDTGDVACDHYHRSPDDVALWRSLGLRAYLIALERAIADGVDVRGYFHWSIMDNFEWAEGCKQRFGLIHVDYATQRRTPKDSALWYREVMASNGASLHS